MSFWLPSSARWPLDPGLRREDENEFPSRFSFVSPAKAGAQGPRWGSPLPRRTSAQQAFRRHNVPGVVERDSSFCAAEAPVARCPSGCHPVRGGPWIPAFAGKTKMSFLRAFFSFPPRKRGPRGRGGAVPAQANFSAASVPPAQCPGAVERDSSFCAAEAPVARCPSGCHPMRGGPWIPAFAGKTKMSFLHAFFSFPPRKRGPRGRGGAVPCPGELQRSKRSAGTMLGCC